MVTAVGVAVAVAVAEAVVVTAVVEKGLAEGGPGKG